MDTPKVIEPDILQVIYEEKSLWPIIKNQKSQQIYSKEVIFQKSFNVKEEDSIIFNEYVEEYKALKHKCLNKLKYIILPNREQMKNGCLCTEFQNCNLKDKIMNLSYEIEKNRINDSQKFIIIFGIAKFMEFLETKNKFHGKLNVLNIFLVNKFWPIISDPLVHHIFKKYNVNKKKLCFESLICYPREYYLKNILNIKTDVYSYGILLIQLFTEQIKITENDSNLYEKILKGEKCNFEFNLPEDISSLIIQCIEEDPSSRTDFKSIVGTLLKIYNNNVAYKSDEFEEYKKYIDEPDKIDVIIENNNIIKKYKEDADKGQPLAMYLYGKSKYEGDKCVMNKKIGIKYLSSAAILKNKEAINFFKVIELEKKLLNENKDNPREEDSLSDEDIKSQSNSGKNHEQMKEKNNNINIKIKPLYEDKFFNQ